MCHPKFHGLDGNVKSHGLSSSSSRSLQIQIVSGCWILTQLASNCVALNLDCYQSYYKDNLKSRNTLQLLCKVSINKIEACLLIGHMGSSFAHLDCLLG